MGRLFLRASLVHLFSSIQHLVAPTASLSSPFVFLHHSAVTIALKALQSLRLHLPCRLTRSRSTYFFSSLHKHPQRADRVSNQFDTGLNAVQSLRRPWPFIKMSDSEDDMPLGSKRTCYNDLHLRARLAFISPQPNTSPIPFDLSPYKSIPLTHATFFKLD